MGDPKQLPPIGAGRPFVDIVEKLTPDSIETNFPKVGTGYAELTIRRRQKGEEREDLLFAEWFSGRPMGPGDDEIFDHIMSGKSFERLRFIQWDDPETLGDEVLSVLVQELKLSGMTDTEGFAIKLGGKVSNGYIYFNRGSAEYAENWQILSPLKGLSYGVRDLNRLIQKTFRSQTMELAHSRSKSIPKPMGPDNVIYGDKVINTYNQRRNNVYPTEKSLNYVANGEIGIIIGMFRKKYQEWKRALPLNVEFTSQKGFNYTFYGNEFKDEGNPPLELAYAITVHRAQGSEFGLTILILPNPCWLLSRELLYTALTRQRDRVVIFHQGSIADLKNYSSEYHSETARRITDLFKEPKQVLLIDRLFEDSLIHRANDGTPMRSKSEVIIADNLSARGIDYAYEEILEGTGGSHKLPDFTIEDAETGITYYWEHLGMLSKKSYRERWERKLEWYRSQGILPLEEGGGDEGTLITTRDTKEGGISSEEIKKLVEEVFG